MAAVNEMHDFCCMDCIKIPWNLAPLAGSDRAGRLTAVDLSGILSTRLTHTKLVLRREIRKVASRLVTASQRGHSLSRVRVQCIQRKRCQITFGIARGVGVV